MPYQRLFLLLFSQSMTQTALNSHAIFDSLLIFLL